MTKIFAAIIAASLIITPASAETKPQCVKGDILTGAAIVFVVSYVTLRALIWLGEGAIAYGAKKEREKLKEQHPDCKL